jgi:hypothetical protein
MRRNNCKMRRKRKQNIFFVGVGRGQGEEHRTKEYV